MEEQQNKLVIELSFWEAERINTGIKVMIDTFLSSPDNFKNIPQDSIKAVSFLIALRAKLFDCQKKSSLKTADCI